MRVAAPMATGGPACASPPPPTSVLTAVLAGSHPRAAQGHREGKRGRGLLTRAGRPKARSRRRRGSQEVSLLPALRAHAGLTQLTDRALGRVSAAQTRAQAWGPGLHPLAGTTKRLGSTWRGESWADARVRQIPASLDRRVCLRGSNLSESPVPYLWVGGCPGPTDLLPGFL